MKRDLDTASDGEWQVASQRAILLTVIAETPRNWRTSYARRAVIRIKENSTY